MADGITNPTYAGVDGLGIVNDLDGLETAIQDASASNKRLLVNKVEGNNGTAYFVSAESKTARAIRNIKAFFGQGETGRAHDAKVKDALVGVASVVTVSVLNRVGLADQLQRRTTTCSAG